MAQADTEMVPLNRTAAAVGPSSGAAEEDDHINSYLGTEAGLSWLAGQLASWDATAKRGAQGFQEFGSSLKTAFQKDVVSKMPAGFPWDHHFANLRAAGTLDNPLTIQRMPQLPSLPNLPNMPNLSGLPPYLLNKYFNARVRLMVDETVQSFIKVAALTVPASCIVFEAAKHAAVYSVRKATGPVGPVSRWLLQAALPTGFYGPAIGCFLAIRRLLHNAAKNEQRRKEIEEQARIAVLQEQAAAPGNFTAFLKSDPKGK